MISRNPMAARLKIVVAILLFSLVPPSMVGLTVYLFAREAVGDRINKDLRGLGEDRRGALQQFFQDRIANLTAITSTQSRRTLQNHSELVSILNLVRLQSTYFVEIEVIDHGGKRLAVSGSPGSGEPPANYSNETWFDAVMSPGVYISDAFMGAGGVPQMFISVGKLEEGGNWAVRAAIKTDFIRDILSSAQLGPRDDAFVVNAANVLQANSRSGGAFLSRPVAPDFSSSPGIMIQPTEENGVENLYVAASLSIPGWVLVIKEDIGDRMGGVLRLRNVLCVLLALSSVLIIGGAFFISGSLTSATGSRDTGASSKRDALIQSSKMAALGKMAAGIAHEINNPLAIIGETAGWMKDILTEDDVAGSPHFKELETSATKIRDQVERCKIVTHHLLRFGRRIAPIQETVDVNQILIETVTLFESEAYFRDIEIKKDYDPNLPRISTDPTQVQQVFLNIIDNALDAVGNSGVIGIRTGTLPGSGKEIMVEISDTGPGIPKSILGNVFDPFFTTKSVDEGKGLGLSVSYSIIESLRGEIRVTCEEGKGTTFTIVLPVM